MPSAEALAMVVLEASGTPLVASNADLTGAGGLGNDLAARFLHGLAGAAQLTLHVRLIEGDPIREGQTLAFLDDSQISLQVSSLESSLDAAKKSAKEGDSSVAAGSDSATCS